MVTQQSAYLRPSYCRYLAVFVTFFAFLQSAIVSISRGVPSLIISIVRCLPYLILSPDLKGFYRQPSEHQEFTDAEFRSIVMRKLSELEEKVNTMQTKPMQMPSEKEELLNAAIYRVDALEAELITTKKVAFVAFLLYYPALLLIIQVFLG